MKRIIRSLRKFMHASLLSIIRTDEGELRPVPNHILFLTVFLCLNVLLQGLADIALKLLSYTDILEPLPWRTDFLFLTAVSVLMGYRTITGMHRRKFDVTRNSIELGLLTEVGLVVGDCEFIWKNLLEIPHVFAMRMPFIVLTSINIVILLYTYHALKLRSWMGRG